MSAESVDIARSLDCRGLNCPLPIYKTSAALKTLVAGEVLEIVCTDPGAVADFEALARQTGHTLLTTEASDGEQRFLLRKRG